MKLGGNSGGGEGKNWRGLNEGEFGQNTLHDILKKYKKYKH